MPFISRRFAKRRALEIMQEAEARRLALAQREAAFFVDGDDYYATELTRSIATAYVRQCDDRRIVIKSRHK